MSERGSVLSVEFLIVAVLLLFLVFGATDYWLIQVKMQHAEHIKNYYLDRMRVEGYLTASDEAEMVNRFADIGCTVIGIDAPRESQGDPRILRNAEDPALSEVWLRVEAGINQRPFLLGRFLGLEGPDGLVIRVAGRALSERVSP